MRRVLPFPVSLGVSHSHAEHRPIHRAPSLFNKRSGSAAACPAKKASANLTCSIRVCSRHLFVRASASPNGEVHPTPQPSSEATPDWLEDSQDNIDEADAWVEELDTSGELEQQLSSRPSPELLSREDRALGIMLGAMCGNVLGAPVHLDRPYVVCRRFPDGLVDFFKYDVGIHPAEHGTYSGEFTMMLGVAESLVQAGACDSYHQANTLASLWSQIKGASKEPPPAAVTELDIDISRPRMPVAKEQDTTASLFPSYMGRRFGLYDAIILDALTTTRVPLSVIPHVAQHFLNSSTTRSSSAASDRFEKEPIGPADNSGACRIAPLALAYSEAPPSVLKAAVSEAVVFSHSHPEGMDGALVMAAATQWLLQHEPDSSTPEQLLQHLEGVATTEDMRSNLALLKSNLFQIGDIETTEGWRKTLRSPSWTRLMSLASRMSLNGYATTGTEAVGVSLLALVTSWGLPRQAVCVSATLGCSAPITSQMSGALVGAFHGVSWIPQSWWEQLENGFLGRDAVVRTAVELASLQCMAVGVPTSDGNRSPEASAVA